MSLVDPIIPLAFSMHEGKGIHALLLGSGVSRAAGIPTGWEVVLDLTRKVAHLQNENCEPDPAQWYYTRFGTYPDYARLLEMLGASQAERSTLLRAYFEPNEEERERGLKTPTGAHTAIAELVARGYVRVIITTNFDRLLEQAVESAGVIPTVISTPDAAEGALPLTHNRCTIVKVHGDYLDPRVKNTVEELEQYDERVDALLGRVFDDYALVVCGWSAEWDTALRAALERCATRRFSTYWASRGGHDAEAAKRLMGLRRAYRIQVQDADAFFRDLAEKVIALEEYTGPHPLATRVAVARAKRYLSEERHHIRLHDLVKDETERVYAVLSDANFPVQGVSFNAEELTRRLSSYEGSLETLIPLLATGCYWGTPAHQRIWVRALERIGTPSGGRGGIIDWLDLRLYPVLLLLYASGVGAIAADNYNTLAALLGGPMDYQERGRIPLALKLSPGAVVDGNAMNEALGQQLLVPVNEHVFEVLRAPLQELLPDDMVYERTFDRFECLFALIYADILEKREEGIGGPIGRFGHRFRGKLEQNPFNSLISEAEEQKESWGPLKAGLFSGDYSRFEQIAKEYMNWVRKVVREW